jgi:N-formylglutamate deformylase
MIALTFVGSAEIRSSAPKSQSARAFAAGRRKRSSTPSAVSPLIVRACRHANCSAISRSSLYPGMTTTGLVPAETFRGESVWRDAPPSDEEIAVRRERWWRPYHDALSGELARLRAVHPRVVLWDAHSIASVLPRFFEGRLPDLNFGTADGASCEASLIEAVLEPVRVQADYSWVLNGRYKGGHITRHHGQPRDGVHAIQLEMVQAIYMDESSPFALDEARSARLRPLLRACLGRALDWAVTG